MLNSYMTAAYDNKAFFIPELASEICTSEPYTKKNKQKKNCGFQVVQVTQDDEL